VGKARVISVRGLDPAAWLADPDHVYIGRRTPNGWPDSPWRNPFKIGRDGTWEEVIAKYEARIRTRPDLLAALPELRGKVLGCWCAPQACHGDVLSRLASDGGDTHGKS
jgi:hypothetical protein